MGRDVAQNQDSPLGLLKLISLHRLFPRPRHDIPFIITWQDGATQWRCFDGLALAHKDVTAGHLLQICVSLGIKVDHICRVGDWATKKGGRARRWERVQAYPAHPALWGSIHGRCSMPCKTQLPAPNSRLLCTQMVTNRVGLRVVLHGMSAHTCPECTANPQVCYKTPQQALPAPQ